MRRRVRRCPRCGQPHAGRVRKCVVCETPLTRPRWKMTKQRIKAVHVKARAQKGLDEETYRDRLAQVGVQSCKEMKRQQYVDFMKALDKLPDVETWKTRRQRAA